MNLLELALIRVMDVLGRLSVPYAVMGGLAVRVYAIPRFTKDVQDIFFTMGQLDIDYLRRWANDLAITPALEASLLQ